MKTNSINRLLSLLLISCAFAPTSRADDDTHKLIGGIAAGIVGMALEQASAQEASAADVGEIKWNAASPSRPKIQYDDRVAEIQLKLKKINLYSGKIDGLKGHETTEAIKSWEQFNSDSVDGEISDEEMAVLYENAAASSKDDKQLSNNTKSVKQNERKKTSNTVKMPGAGSITFIDSTRDDKNELELLFYNGAAYKEQYDICRDFQDKYVTFHYRIDKNLEKNYTKYRDASNKAATDIAECKSLSGKEIADLRELIESEYANSNESKIARIRAGHTFIEDGEVSELVARCNLLSNSLTTDTLKVASANGQNECKE